MNFIWFILVCVAVFLSVLLGGRKYRSTALYALAIGGVVNANFFHAAAYPIDCFGLPFGIDSIIYTLFVFCVIVMLLKSSKKEAYILADSSIIAIMFSALMQLFADLLSKGSTVSVWNTFLLFVTSSVASTIAIIVMVEVLSRLIKKLNPYVLMILGIVIATLINSIIYYPVSMIISGTPANIGILLLTSLIGKGLALGMAVFTLWLINVVDSKTKEN